MYILNFFTFLFKNSSYSLYLSLKDVFYCTNHVGMTNRMNTISRKKNLINQTDEEKVRFLLKFNSSLIKI